MFIVVRASHHAWCPAASLLVLWLLEKPIKKEIWGRLLSLCHSSSCRRLRSTSKTMTTTSTQVFHVATTIARGHPYIRPIPSVFMVLGLPLKVVARRLLCQFAPSHWLSASLEASSLLSRSPAHLGRQACLYMGAGGIGGAHIIVYVDSDVEYYSPLTISLEALTFPHHPIYGALSRSVINSLAVRRRPCYPSIRDSNPAASCAVFLSMTHLLVLATHLVPRSRALHYYSN